MVGGVVQWGQPAHGHIGLIHQLVRQLENGLDGLGVEQEPIQGKPHCPGHAAQLALMEVAGQHDEGEQQGVQEHEQEDGGHALIGPAHLQGFDQGGQGHGLTCPGIAQDGRGLRPHVPHEGLAHTHKGGGNQHEQQVKEGGQGHIDGLAQEPGSPVHAAQEEGGTGGETGHVREEQQEQEAGQQDGIAVPKGPDKGLHDLHGGFVFLGELHGLIRKEEAQHKGQGKGEIDAGVAAPAPKMALGHDAGLTESFHIWRSLLFAAQAKSRAMRALNSSSSTATPTRPNTHLLEGFSHSRG